jgi:hypothetical protein
MKTAYVTSPEHIGTPHHTDPLRLEAHAEHIKTWEDGEDEYQNASSLGAFVCLGSQTKVIPRFSAQRRACGTHKGRWRVAPLG